MLFITGYYTDEQVYQKIDTVQCKRVYLSAKGVSTQQVPLLGTVLLVNECVCVFCAEVFLLLVGFFLELCTLYFVQKTKLFATSLCCRVVFTFPPLLLIFFAFSS